MTYPEDLNERVIEAFEEYWNSPNSENSWKIPTKKQMTALSKHWEKVISRRFVDCTEDFHILRMSAVGKPIIETLWNAFHYDEYCNLRRLETVRGHQRMSMGDEFEIDLAVHLIRMGFNVSLAEEQTELVHRDVTGHVDYIVSHPDITDGEPILLECKANAPHIWDKYSKYGPNDDWGYKTQLGLYSKLTGLPAFWVLFNKSTSELAVVPYDRHYTEEDKDLALARLDYLIDCWEELNEQFHPDNWPIVFTKARPPEPIPEVYKNVNTGRYLIPPCMRYANSTFSVYEIESGKNSYSKPQTYIVDYLYPEEYAHLKPELPEV